MASRRTKRRQQPRRVERFSHVRPQPSPRPAPTTHPRRWVTIDRRQGQQPAIRAWYAADRSLYETIARDRDRRPLLDWIGRWFATADVREAMPLTKG